MNEWVIPSMGVDAGHAYDEWISRLSQGLKDLVKEGRAPEFAGLDNFFDVNDKVRAHIKAGADNAARSGQRTYSVRIPITPQEFKLLGDMGGSLLNYLEVLTIRGVVEATPSQAVQDAIAAMGAGEMTGE